MRLLITGASGDLGRPLSSLAARSWDTTGTFYRHPLVGGGQSVQLDLRDRQHTLSLIDELRPDTIIHAAVSDTSDEASTAIPVAARHISEGAHRVGAHLIALSTDMVFDGTEPPYTEASPCRPRTIYGQAKALSERILQYQHDNLLIVRTSLIYDLDPQNRQISWLLHKIKEGQAIMLFEDEIRQPIWAWNLASAVLELASLGCRGILHVAGPQPMNRWEYGSALLQALGYEPRAVAVRAQAADIAPNRPRNCTLCLSRAKSLLSTPLLTVHEALAQAQNGAKHHPA